MNGANMHETHRIRFYNILQSKTRAAIKLIDMRLTAVCKKRQELETEIERLENRRNSFHSESAIATSADAKISSNLLASKLAFGQTCQTEALKTSGEIARQYAAQRYLNRLQQQIVCQLQFETKRNGIIDKFIMEHEGRRRAVRRARNEIAVHELFSSQISALAQKEIGR